MYTLNLFGSAVRELKQIGLPFQAIIKERLLVIAESPDILKNHIVRQAGTKAAYCRLRVGNEG